MKSLAIYEGLNALDISKLLIKRSHLKGALDSRIEYVKECISSNILQICFPSFEHDGHKYRVNSIHVLYDEEKAVLHMAGTLRDLEHDCTFVPLPYQELDCQVELRRNYDVLRFEMEQFNSSPCLPENLLYSSLRSLLLKCHDILLEMEENHKVVDGLQQEHLKRFALYARDRWEEERKSSDEAKRWHLAAIAKPIPHGEFPCLRFLFLVNDWPTKVTAAQKSIILRLEEGLDLDLIPSWGQSLETVCNVRGLARLVDVGAVQPTDFEELWHQLTCRLLNGN